ncbi:unnamed protein product [Urochloa humidicola]
METLISHPARGHSESPAARHRWVLLNPQLKCIARDNSSVADANTAAACCTSWGQSFTISFSPAAPPASSIFYCHRLYGTAENDDGSPMDLSIIAAHDDCVFLQARVPKRYRDHSSSSDFDYFLYESGGATRLPSLSPLPGCYISMMFERDEDPRNVPTLQSNTRFLEKDDTAVLRLSDGEVLVTQLEITYDKPHETAELCVW